jgi:hypothetical protein
MVTCVVYFLSELILSSHAHQPSFTPQKHFFAYDTHFLLEAE